MKVIALFILILFTLKPQARQININGTVTNDACEGGIIAKGCHLFKETRVSIGSISCVTDSKGHFTAQLPNIYDPGQEVIANVDYPNYCIFTPYHGRFNLTNTTTQNVFELKIILVPKGSPRILDHQRLIDLIQEIAIKKAREIESNHQEIFKDKLRYFEDFAKYHGFTPAHVKKMVDEWVFSVNEKEIRNLTELGAIKYYKGLFKEASLAYEQAAIKQRSVSAIISANLSKAIEQYRIDREKGYQYFLLSANSSMEDRNYKRSISLYNMAQDALHVSDPLKGLIKEAISENQLINRNLAYAMTMEGLRVSGSLRKTYLEKSISIFQLALKDFSKDTSLVNYMYTLNNYGIALYNLSLIVDSDRAKSIIDSAIFAYRTSLELKKVYLPPEQWLNTMNNIGNALYSKATYYSDIEKSKILNEAIAKFDTVLLARSTSNKSDSWANTLCNRAIALSEKGKLTFGLLGDSLLVEAINDFERSMLIRTKQKFPRQWAMTQYNLAWNYLWYAERVPFSQQGTLLKKAKLSFQKSLGVRTREKGPVAWAASQYGLGVALRKSGVISNDKNSQISLSEAVECLKLALQVYTNQYMQLEWASAQFELSKCLLELGAIKNNAISKKLLSESISILNSLLLMENKNNLPENENNIKIQLSKAVSLLNNGQ